MMVQDAGELPAVVPEPPKPTEPRPVIAKRAAKEAAAVPSDKLCPITLCSISIKKSKKLCAYHNNPYENIWRATFPRQKAKQFQPEEYNEEQQAFVVIFGDRKKPLDPELATKAIEDYLTEYPDGEDYQKQGKARGSARLSSYVNNRGTRQSQLKKSDDPLWDSEMLKTQMAALRGLRLR